MDWMPIETAPMWESILVAYDCGEIELIDSEDNDFAWTAYDGKNENEKGVSKPTHWMLCPKPPETK